jgi:hypothetical protein
MKGTTDVCITLFYANDILHRESSDDSGTDEEEEKQTIPDWARGVKLREALERQYGLHCDPVDPDLIFSDIQTCSLEEIFGKSEGKCGK